MEKNAVWVDACGQYSVIFKTMSTISEYKLNITRHSDILYAEIFKDRY